MKIAFISYEYPPDTAEGGIATYLREAVPMLASRGHLVEVIAGSTSRTGSFSESGATIHRLRPAMREDFARLAGECFAERHKEIGFDVLEGPDAMSDASHAVRLVPEIPLVLKLHTPGFLRNRNNLGRMGALRRGRIYLGAVRRGVPPFYRYDRTCCPEYRHALDADHYAAPSRSIARIVSKDWNLPPEQVSCYPLPYQPNRSLLDLPFPGGNKVLFVGRLEPFKGVFELAAAIPRVLRLRPDARFTLVGATVYPAGGGEDLRTVLMRQLEPWKAQVSFRDKVPLSEVPGVLGESDICVLPSRWDNFPVACLEAMAAGRAVIGTQYGGMAEMLAEPRTGRIVDSFSPRSIARAVIEFLDSHQLQRECGARARERVLREYSPATIAPAQERSYEAAIRRRIAIGSRARPRYASQQVREQVAAPWLAENP